MNKYRREPKLQSLAFKTGQGPRYAPVSENIIIYWVPVIMTFLQNYSHTYISSARSMPDLN